MSHTGDKYPFEYYKRQKLQESLTQRDNTWAMYPSYIKAQYLADEAIKQQGWLFDPTTKRWFTPEEFIAETRTFPTGAEIFNVIQIKNPVDGINAGYA